MQGTDRDNFGPLQSILFSAVIVMHKVALVILVILNIISFFTLRQPESFLELKKRYLSFIDVLPEEFKMLRTRSIITGTTTEGKLGHNTNKGYEIAICIDDDVNSMFHVLLHELAHCTVSEYEHSDKFWGNFDKLKNIAVENNLYVPIQAETPFCGKKIKD